jgi:hypothetical protein
VIRFCGYVGIMKWQQFLPVIIVVVAAVVLIWRSAGKKSGGCGCKCGCAHEPDAGTGKDKAAH